MQDELYDIYQEHVLDHYEDPYKRGTCPNATHSHEDANPLCGDRIQIEIKLSEDGKIEDIYFNGEGCCISIASSSMLLEKFDGLTVEDVEKFTAQEMLELFGPKLTPNRQKCCLLPYRVIKQAIYSPLDDQDKDK